MEPSLSISSNLNAGSTLEHPPTTQSDYNTFLKMLTAQLKNQDPLNPQQSTDFALQLATFSGVEQQVLSNQKLSSIYSHISNFNISQLAEWIGMETRVSTYINYDKTPITLYPEFPNESDSVEVKIYDNKGELKDIFTILPSQQTIEFSGITSAGEVLPPGKYTLRLAALRDEKVIDQSEVSIYAKIVETSKNTSGEIILTLSNGEKIQSSEVKYLRNSDTSLNK